VAGKRVVIIIGGEPLDSAWTEQFIGNTDGRVAPRKHKTLAVILRPVRERS
jgi:hypothetical protein